MKQVKFLAEPQFFHSNADFVAHLPKVKSKDELFDQLRNILKLPNYFGNNWDALYDCLRDFHWIEEKSIVLVHDRLPELDKQTLSVYFDIIFQAANDWNEGEEHCFEIIFPEDTKALIQQYCEK